MFWTLKVKPLVASRQSWKEDFICCSKMGEQLFLNMCSFCEWNVLPSSYSSKRNHDWINIYNKIRKCENISQTRTVHFCQGGMQGWMVFSTQVIKTLLHNAPFQAKIPLFGPFSGSPCPPGSVFLAMVWYMSSNYQRNTPQFRAPQCQWVVACLGYIANYSNNYGGEWQHYTMQTIMGIKRVAVKSRV